MKELENVQGCEQEAHELLSFCLDWSSNTLDMRNEIRLSESRLSTQVDTYKLVEDKDNRRWSYIVQLQDNFFSL